MTNVKIWNVSEFETRLAGLWHRVCILLPLSRLLEDPGVALGILLLQLVQSRPDITNGRIIIKQTHRPHQTSSHSSSSSSPSPAGTSSQLAMVDTLQKCNNWSNNESQSVLTYWLYNVHTLSRSKNENIDPFNIQMQPFVTSLYTLDPNVNLVLKWCDEVTLTAHFHESSTWWKFS